MLSRDIIIPWGSGSVGLGIRWTGPRLCLWTRIVQLWMCRWSYPGQSHNAWNMNSYKSKQSIWNFLFYVDNMIVFWMKHPEQWKYPPIKQGEKFSKFRVPLLAWARTVCLPVEVASYKVVYFLLRLSVFVLKLVYSAEFDNIQPIRCDQIWNRQNSMG